MKRFTNRKGFTLIEILIAVSIIAILTAIGIVSYASVNRRARDAKRFGDLEQIRSALEMYRSDNGYYPAVNTGSFGGVSALDAPLNTSGGYIQALPTDPQPTKHSYFYEANNSTSGKYYGYCLCSFLETQSTVTSTCGGGVTLPADCLYGVRNP